MEYIRITSIDEIKIIHIDENNTAIKINDEKIVHLKDIKSFWYRRNELKIGKGNNSLNDKSTS